MYERENSFLFFFFNATNINSNWYVKKKFSSFVSSCDVGNIKIIIFFTNSYKSLRLVLILLLRIFRLKLLSEVKSIIETKLILCITINYRKKYVEHRAKLLKI